MKYRVNSKIIKKMNPCKDRYDNWLNHYMSFNGNIIDFLQLSNISTKDKIWVAVRLLDRFTLEVFAIDCAFSAAAANAAAYAAYAAAAYAAAAYAANADAAAADAAAYAANAANAAERDNQIRALIWLIENED